MRRFLFLAGSLLVAALAIATGIAACSGEDAAKIPDASDAKVVETGPDCGKLPMLTCFPGAPYKACGNFPQPIKAIDGSAPCFVYGCGPGTVEVSLCGCQAETLKIEAGADCPGMDASSD
jgi:hypothetical protein